MSKNMTDPTEVAAEVLRYTDRYGLGDVYREREVILARAVQAMQERLDAAEAVMRAAWTQLERSTPRRGEGRYHIAAIDALRKATKGGGGE